MDFSKWTDAQVCNALLYLANHRLLYTRGVSEDHSRLLVGLVYKLRSLGVLTQPQICAAKLRLPLYERHIQGYEIPQVIVPGQSPCRFLLHNRHKLRIYSPSLVAKRLSVLTGLEWDSERCFYTCDATRRNAHVLLEFSFVPDTRASAWMEGEAPKPPLVDLSALKMQLKHYQVEGASFIVSRNGRALLSDEMGLGKTAQAIAWAWYSNLTKVCVCCPASLKENWAREITMWTGEESICQIFGKRVTVELENSIRASKWIIINYDLVDAWKEVLSQAGIQAYILDEAQAIKNWEPPKKKKKKRSVSKRAEAVVCLTKECPYVVAISGTPFENRPIELFPVLHILDPVLFSSHVAYGKRFCDLRLNSFGGYDMTGASNLQEFNKLLRDTYMIRRRKVDVLQELPEKSRVVIPLRLEKSQRVKYQQAEDQFIEWLMFNRAQRDTNLTKSQVLDQFVEWVMSDDADNGEMQVTKAVSMIKANALKQLAALAKMPLVIDWIDTYLENQSKLVVFAGHHEVIDILSKEYKGRCVVIDGRTPVTQRQGIVDAFQNDPKVNLFIGNIRAAGTGLTLTAAQDTVTVELDWNPAYHMQAEDRVHRIGQRNAVTAYYLLAKDTFETRVAEVLDKKQQILSMVLNGTPSDCAPLATGSKK